MVTKGTVTKTMVTKGMVTEGAVPSPLPVNGGGVVGRRDGN